MDQSSVARAVLAAGAAAYALAVAAASQAPGPRAWALHLPGFLSPSSRLLVMALIFGGAILLAIDFLRAGPRRAGDAPRAKGAARDASRPRAARGRPAARTVKKKTSLPGWTGWLLLLPWAWILWRLVARTRFLGDGTVWLDGIRSGHPNPFSEPLAAATWKGFGWILRALGLPIDPVTAGLLPILCGIAAAALLWGIASELTRRSGSRPIVFAVLGTLGIVQLYFGYIESYPMVSVVVLAFLWLGLRRARDLDHPLWLAAAFAITIPFHLATLFLAPSYLYLLLREKRPLLQRAAFAVLPAAGAAGLLVLLGYPPSRWIGAFRIAARAVEPGHGAAMFAKPYAAVSLDHAWDMLNAILLVLPVPAMLLLAAAVSRAPGRDPAGTAPARDAATIFLAAAALPGLLMAALLVLPVPPAQDWDLTSVLLLPLAVFGVKVGCSIARVPLSGVRGIALAMVGAGALLSFVLVNANEESGLRRFETIVGPGAKITAYGRAYGNELLATYDVSRKDFARALVHAQRAIEAENTNPRYWIKKGAALYELGRYDEAIPVLEEGIRRGPARDDAYYDLGNCYARMRRYPEAVALYREAIRLGEPRPDYFNNLGVALYNVGDMDSARTLWTEVVRRWPWYTLSARSLMHRFGPGALDSARVSPTRG
jgi:tetratricopeptide (TPR) repeat protein